MTKGSKHTWLFIRQLGHNTPDMTGNENHKVPRSDPCGTPGVNSLCSVRLALL